MTKYKYTGTEDKIYVSCTGERFHLSKGTIFETKCNPNLDNIEEVKETEGKKKHDSK